MAQIKGKLSPGMMLWNMLISMLQLVFLAAVGGFAYYLAISSNSRSHFLAYLLAGLALIAGGVTALQTLKARVAPANTLKTSRATPAGSQGHLQQGIAYLKQGNNQAALSSFNKQLNQTPQNSETWLYKGKALTQMGRSAEASECYYQYYQLSGQLQAAANKAGETPVPPPKAAPVKSQKT